uniref:Secreted protein n=1 Tax=Parascaris equorum TaxID=6256 RepID=A0A914SK29_PAREQ
MVIKDRWALTCAHLIVLEIAKCIADHISACTFQCNEPQIVPPTHGRRIPCERMKIHIRASKRFCMEVPVGLFLEV